MPPPPIPNPKNPPLSSANVIFVLAKNNVKMSFVRLNRGLDFSCDLVNMLCMGGGMCYTILLHCLSFRVFKIKAQ